MCLVFSHVRYQDSPWVGRSFPKHDSICSSIAIYDSKVLGGMSGEVGMSTIIQGKPMLSDKTAPLVSRSHSSLLNRTAETAASTVCLSMTGIKRNGQKYLLQNAEDSVGVICNTHTTESFFCKSLQEQEVRLIFCFQQSKRFCRDNLNIATVAHRGVKQGLAWACGQFITPAAKEQHRLGLLLCYLIVLGSCLQDWWTQHLEKWNCLLVVNCWCSQLLLHVPLVLLSHPSKYSLLW